MTPLWESKVRDGGTAHSLCPLPGSAQVLIGGQGRGYRVLCLDAEKGEAAWDREVLGARRDYTVSVAQLGLAPDGEHFVVVGSEGDTMLHRVHDDNSPGVPLTIRGNGLVPIFSGPERLTLATRGTTVWNWKTGQRIARHPSEYLQPCGGDRFLSRTVPQIILRQMGGREPAWMEWQPGSGKTAFELDAAGHRLLLSGREGTAELVDLETRQRIGPAVRHAPPPEVAPTEKEKPRRMIARPRLAADGSAFVVWQDERTLAVYAAVGDRVPLLVPSASPIRCAALSPDGKRLAFATEDGIWKAWNIPEGRPMYSSPALLASPGNEGAYHERGVVMCMEFSSDGARLAIGTERWCTVSIWRTEDGAAIQPPAMQAHSVADLCFAPDAAGTLWSADWLGQCRRWDAPPYELDQLAPFFSVFAPVPDCAVSPDGRWIAAASWNRTATVHDAATLQDQPPAMEHTGEVTSVDWSPDGRRLLTASATGEIYVWDRQTGRRMFSWPQLDVKGQTAAVVQAAFALNDSRIVIARMDGQVRMREVYAGGRVGADWADKLEAMCGYRIGDDGQLLPWRGE